MLQPDFIFITRRDNGDLAASMIDPHSSHLSDALSKLVGLAAFAEKYGDAYRPQHEGRRGPGGRQSRIQHERPL